MKGKWLRIWIGMVAIAPGACSALTPTAAAEAGGWQTAALHTADDLAKRLRAAGIKCDEYEPAVFASYGEAYRERLPLAAAVASCTTHADEDLTFEVFEGAAQAQDFIRAKQALLCKRAAKAKVLDFPGFAYVDGGVWVVEPDEKATADEIAPILRGQSKMAGCGSTPAP